MSNVSLLSCIYITYIYSKYIAYLYNINSQGKLRLGLGLLGVLLSTMHAQLYKVKTAKQIVIFILYVIKFYIALGTTAKLFIVVVVYPIRNTFIFIFLAVLES